MKIKKILIIPVVIISVLISCVSLSAFADFDASEVNGGDPLYFSKSECIEKVGASDNYIFANLDHMQYSSSFGCDRHNAITFYYRLSDNVTYTEENGYYVVDISGSSMCYKSGEWHYDTDRDRTISDRWGTGSNNLWTSSSSSIKIKTDLSEIVWGSTTYSSSEFVNFEYKIGELEDKYSSVRVVFTPPLVGDVDRRVSVNGLSSLLSSLQVDISNNGSSAIQYSMAIYEKNNLTVRNGSLNPDIYYGDDPVFILYKNAWVWCPQMNADSNGIFTNIPIEYQKASEWHYLAAHSSDSFQINFSQINLKQGVEYTVVVKSVLCPFDHASVVTSDSDYVDCKIDFSTVETVYQSDFRMLQYNDVVYDPEDESFGVLPYDGYSGNGQSNLYGTSYNAFGLDGQVFIEPHKGSTGSNFGNNFFPDSSQTNYNTVLSQSSSVMTFFANVLSFFPTNLWSICNIALWLALIIFLIRRFS